MDLRGSSVAMTWAVEAKAVVLYGDEQRSRSLKKKFHLSLLGINASMKIGMRMRRSSVEIPESMYCPHESDVNVMWFNCKDQLFVANIDGHIAGYCMTNY